MKNVLYATVLGIGMIGMSCNAPRVTQVKEGDIRYEVPGKGWTLNKPVLPDWVNKPGKFSDKENLVFVGVSRKYATESDARDDALRSALDQIVRYFQSSVGLKMLDVAKKKNLSNEIVNPAIVGEVIRKEISVATLKSMYVNEYYTLHAQKFGNGAWGDDYYVSYAMVKLPRSVIKQIREDMIRQAQERIRQEIAKTKNEQRKQLLREAEKDFEKLKKEGF